MAGKKARKRKKTRRIPPLSPPPDAVVATPPNFFPGVSPSSRSIARNLMHKYIAAVLAEPTITDESYDPHPFGRISTVYLKRIFNQIHKQLQRLRAEFPEANDDPTVDLRDQRGPYTPAREIAEFISDGTTRPALRP